MKFLIIILLLFLTGCTDSKCHLLSVAYNEQDELSSEWYRLTAKELRECGYIVHEDTSRGRSIN